MCVGRTGVRAEGDSLGGCCNDVRSHDGAEARVMAVKVGQNRPFLVLS